MKAIFSVIILLTASVAAFAQKNISGFQIVERKANKQVDILYKGQLLTAYCYYDSIRKPFLYPINTIDGITITRGFPIKPLAGEPTDHPHHTGSWLNYENVNGLDFWNNSTAIAPEKRNLYGTIVHQQILQEKAAKDSALLTATAQWLQPDGKVLMDEKTTYIFRVKNNNFFIDRTTTLTARDKEVSFKDAKDGFFAIRVAKELQMPEQKENTFVDIHGNKTTVAANNAANGMYYSSEGKTGDSVWSTRGTWTMLKGKKDGKNITIGIIDHPSNVGYPTYWHARGYGLFAANPLGQKVFSNGKQELNFSLKPNTSVTFRYRVVITSDNAITPGDMNKFAEEFKAL